MGIGLTTPSPPIMGFGYGYGIGFTTPGPSIIEF